MNKLKALPALFLAATALADAGYLGSVTAGVSPIGEHPSIAMTAEEVVIELRRERVDYEDWSAEVYSATVTADFLFTNSGEADTVYMYIPHAIVTAFVPILYAAEEMEAPLENPRVLVDGETVEVRKVCLGAFDPTFMEGMSWEDFAELTRPLFAERPGVGEPFYFTRYFADPEADLWELTHPADAVLAWWAVPFAPGQRRLVEYVQEYAPTSDYGEKVFRLTYPLFTGAAWSGAIREGRVSVVGGEGCDWDDLAYHVGLRLPSPKEEEDYRLDVLEPLAGHPAFGKGKLAGYDGEKYPRALVWEFSDYEPDPGRLNFNALYPDIGDIALYQQMLYEDFLAGTAEAYDNPWDYSMIYLYLGRYAPTYYKSVNTDGVPLHDSPGGRLTGESIPFLRGGELLGREGNWVRLSWKDWENDRTVEGWADLEPLDEKGLVAPSLMPMPDTYYGEGDD